MEKVFCIYKHTTPNGKVYIGQTCQKPELRFGNNGHRYRGCTLFYNAIQKYGWDNIQHEIVVDGLSQSEANQYEIDLIRKYRSNERQYGYNLQAGGDNGSPSEITRQKMSAWQIGKELSEETKRKISNSRTGQKDSFDTRLKKSIGHRGKHMSESNKQKLVNACIEKNSKRVLCVETGDVYPSASEASRKIGADKGNLCKACIDQNKTCKGYHWKYIDKD